MGKMKQIYLGISFLLTEINVRVEEEWRELRHDDLETLRARLANRCAQLVEAASESLETVLAHGARVAIVVVVLWFRRNSLDKPESVPDAPGSEPAKKVPPASGVIRRGQHRFSLEVEFDPSEFERAGA